MVEWVNKAVPGFIASWPSVALALVFLAGVLTSIGPCNLSMVPIIMAYVGGRAEMGRVEGFWLSLFFTLGTSTTFTLMGVVIALVGGLFGTARSVLFYLAAAVCIGVGLSLLRVWTLRLPVPARLQRRVPVRRGWWGAYVMGVSMGLVGSQCGTPILLVILSLVMLKGNMVYGAALLFLYALGRGVPVVLAGTFTGLLKNMPVFARWSDLLERAAGVVLLAVGAYFLWSA
ncbi:MAG: cytochrome c biogenesis protein CcdA [Syntrophomonadaceae bacterium]|jgi:cytochrome c-type biogenesis protein|nr:cytochrome c biogenesis protein CcdA [Syntrophomonadaceae bacterium]MDH7498121.1 cytochrome c biogenesis protein CcdA [Syntrophomonadaceae bacterium]